MHEDTEKNLFPSDESPELSDELRDTLHRMRDQMEPSAQVVDELLAAVSQEAASPPVVSHEPQHVAHKKGSPWRFVAAAAAVVLVVVAGFALLQPGGFTKPTTTPSARPPLTGSSIGGVYSPASYEELYNSLQSFWSEMYSARDTGDIVFETDAILMEDSVAGSAATAEASTPQATESGETTAAPIAPSADTPTSDPSASAPQLSPSPTPTAPATTEGDGTNPPALETVTETSSADTSVAPQLDIAASETDESAKELGFSTTNTQVQEVDEGDIVKTDGENLYIVHGQEVIIARAAGANTVELARFTPPLPDVPGDSAKQNASLSDLYISGDTLAVIYSLYLYTPYDQNTAAGEVATGSALGYDGTSTNTTQAALYNVSDPANPQLMGIVGQDGYLSTSRLYDNVLYLATTYYVNDLGVATAEDTRAYVPSLYGAAGFERVLAPGEVCVLPEYDSISYTVLCTIDLTTGARVSTVSVLGRCDTLYMNTHNLYTVEATQETEEVVTPRDDATSYVEYRGTSSSRITRFALDSGTVTLAASAVVPGGLLNQFSLDEYQGYLRAAFTNNTWSSFVLRDNASGGESWVSASSSLDDGQEQSNALYVLDSALAIVGRVEDLAAGERIYSVRFDGTVGYLVTFRQTDPLFAVDLSNPTAPAVMSALKIPGFSQYLHPFAPGRLFGLGMDADANTGTTQGMKMSMFDTSDPYDVTERTTLLLGSGYAEALYSHKAILIDPAQDIIGFAAEIFADQSSSNAPTSWEPLYQYLVFGYSDKQGFYERAAIDLPSWYYGTRGLFIGEYFYVVTGNQVGVFDLATFAEVAWVELPVSEDNGYGYGGGGIIMPLAVPEVAIDE
ncbi:MAG: beta-propeller domain-containing protein [Coriobacteriales bacterium]|jgi:uncharacterized secreted protein with C-terminal beta-propeller domain|nr:beta-propeller domain-containing protein [Coriobacteriales bacterium]